MTKINYRHCTWLTWLSLLFATIFSQFKITLTLYWPKWTKKQLTMANVIFTANCVNTVHRKRLRNEAMFLKNNTLLKVPSASSVTLSLMNPPTMSCDVGIRYNHVLCCVASCYVVAWQLFDDCNKYHHHLNFRMKTLYLLPPLESQQANSGCWVCTTSYSGCDSLGV